MTLPADSVGVYRCPRAGDGGDHVVGRHLEATGLSFPLAGDANPFVRYRTLSWAHALATSHGMSDAAFVDLVRDLDGAVGRVGGRGFLVTPFAPSPALATGLGMSGQVWVKDETHNVSGSHKARHLMGLAILAEVEARVGLAPRDAARLAIASCGNAALAAAVVARACGKPLDVFIPTDASPVVVRELGRLGASVQVCERSPGVAGDPCYLAFREAVDRGAVPFCCQGTDSGLTIEGGETLGWEMISELASHGQHALDRLFVQVGGGALASACVAAFQDARRLGASVDLPRLHAVQTKGAFPLRRAWERLVARLAPRLGLDAAAPDHALAAAVRIHAAEPVVHEELAYAAVHRAEFMWPWEIPPESVAHGILDDETYDWLAIVRGMIESGGFPVVVTEEQLVQANALGRAHTGIDADDTGTAGLAGLLALRGSGVIADDERVALIFSGARRA